MSTEIQEVIHRTVTAAQANARGQETERVLALIDDMMKNPPMRGDIALSDLRRKIEESR